MTKLKHAAPVFEPKKKVLLNGVEVELRDVSVGKEFVMDGVIYQATINKCLFTAVPLETAFRWNDLWCKRTSEKSLCQLEPNAPFGRTVGAVPRGTPQARDSVAVLEVTRRGTVETPASA